MTDIQVFEGDGKMPPEWVAMVKEIDDLKKENAKLLLVIEKDVMAEKNLRDQIDQLREENEDFVRRLNRIHAESTQPYQTEHTRKGDVYEKRFLPVATPPTIYKTDPQLQMESLSSAKERFEKKLDEQPATKNILQRLLEQTIEKTHEKAEKIADDIDPPF